MAPPMSLNPDPYSADYHEDQARNARSDRGEDRYVENVPRAAPSPVDHQDALRMAKVGAELDPPLNLARAYLDLVAKAEALLARPSTPYDWNQAEAALRSCLSSERAP